MIYKYVRFSTCKQDEQQQENMIDRYLANCGMVANNTITDAGISGGVNYEKRQLGNLCKSLKPNDVLVVSEISRITRSGISELSEIIEKYFKPNRLRLIICNVGLDIDCSDINPMMELQLAMMATFATIEKSLIQERTRNALEARKKKIVNEGGFYSKKGKWCTKLGNDGTHTQAASIASAKKRQEVARENASNLAVYKYIRSWEKRNIALNKETPRKVYEELSDILNELGYTTPTGLEFNQLRLRAMWDKLQNLYKDIN